MKLREKIKRIETSRLNRNRRNLTSLMEKMKKRKPTFGRKKPAARKKAAPKRKPAKKTPPRRKSDLWLLMMMTLKIQILKQKIGKGDIWLKKKLNGKHVEYN